MAARLTLFARTLKRRGAGILSEDCSRQRRKRGAGQQALASAPARQSPFAHPPPTAHNARLRRRLMAAVSGNSGRQAMDLWACPAVVTGAASGLGAETARYLAEAGAKVTVIDIDAVGVQKVADEIGGLAIPCDVANSLSAENALATARDAHGAARVLVHCVGRGHSEPTIGPDGPMPLEDFRQLVEVNLISTFNMMRLAA
ncbi:MAG TPA: SDR family NAD(P)-dependent oxidoreductase, partial [Accumulibacter sp.]|nr:SDR family NAD(P)-dependent oxidoreductase [Accumulibacter sp.]